MEVEEHIFKKIYNLVFFNYIISNIIKTYLYWWGFGISLLWSSQTGAGLRYGGLGTGGIVEVAGTIGPVFVFQSTLMASLFVKNTETNNRNELRNWK